MRPPETQAGEKSARDLAHIQHPCVFLLAYLIKHTLSHNQSPIGAGQTLNMQTVIWLDSHQSFKTPKDRDSHLDTQRQSGMYRVCTSHHTPGKSSTFPSLKSERIWKVTGD